MVRHGTYVSLSFWFDLWLTERSTDCCEVTWCEKDELKNAEAAFEFRLETPVSCVEKKAKDCSLSQIAEVMTSLDLKLVLLGHKNVGKTCVFNRYVYDQFGRTTMTIGAYFGMKECSVDNQLVYVWLQHCVCVYVFVSCVVLHCLVLYCLCISCCMSQ
jgi:hypothetical protein